MSSVHLYDTPPWRAVIIGVWAIVSLAVAVGSLGMPTGGGVLFGIVTSVFLGTIVMALSSAIVAFILALIGLPVPRFTMGSILYASVILYKIAIMAEADVPLSMILAGSFILVGATLGWIVWAMFSERIYRFMKIAILTLAAGGGIIVFFLLPGHSEVDVTTDRTNSIDTDSIAADPSVPGTYRYHFFTYGSGNHAHEAAYGEDVDVISDAVDASAYISEWPWLRKMYWGFDETNLPLNGRVWMPEGAGPFPLVLMVHGNHLMEYASDGGYGYLGELLASRGIIAVSIDENFLNYSVWSGMPDEDYQLRAWLLLKHLREIQKFTDDESTPFHHRVDFHQVGLLGHSRGGQAAAMATDRERWFAKNKHLPAPDSYTIQAVAALSPTDTSVDGKRAELENVYYLTLHGAQDADLNHFYGASQYSRTSFPVRSERFKASLYIAHANHVHFNTAWGDYDSSLPKGLFLNLRDLISAEDQRQIAKVYVSAFFETALRGQSQYIPLFRDYRTGRAYLPDTRYYNQFQSGRFSAIARFDDETNSFKRADGITSIAHNIKEKIRVKRGGGKVLKWRRAGSYTLKSNEGFLQKNSSYLSFTMANRGADEESKSNHKSSQVNVDIELTDQTGRSIKFPLERYHPVKPVPQPQYTWSCVFEKHISDGKYTEPEDPVFQTYEIPLDDLQTADSDFSLSEWTQLTFHFRDGPGKVIFKNIGIVR